MAVDNQFLDSILSGDLAGSMQPADSTGSRSYLKQSGLKDIVALSPEERAADRATNENPAVKNELLKEIGRAKDPAARAALEQELKRQGGDPSASLTADPVAQAIKPAATFQPPKMRASEEDKRFKDYALDNNPAFGGAAAKAENNGFSVSKEIGAAIDSYQANLWAIPAAMGSEYALQAMLDNKAAAENGWQDSGAPQSFDEVEFGKNFGQYFAHMALQSSPYMLEFVATGFGVGSAAKAALSNTAKGIAEKAATEAAKLGATKAAAQKAGEAAAASYMGKVYTASGIAGSYPSAVGDVLSNQYEQAGKFDLPTAAALGVPYAALNAAGAEGMAVRAVARGLPKSAISKEGVAGFAGRAALTGAEAGLMEGSTETGQEVMNQLGRMAVDPDAKIDDKRALEAYKESFIAGVLLGGVPGAVAGGFRKPEDAKLQPPAPVANSPLSSAVNTAQHVEKQRQQAAVDDHLEQILGMIAQRDDLTERIAGLQNMIDRADPSSEDGQRIRAMQSDMQMRRDSLVAQLDAAKAFYGGDQMANVGPTNDPLILGNEQMSRIYQVTQNLLNDPASLDPESRSGLLKGFSVMRNRTLPEATRIDAAMSLIATMDDMAARRAAAASGRADEREWNAFASDEAARDGEASRVAPNQQQGMVTQSAPALATDERARKAAAAEYEAAYQDLVKAEQLGVSDQELMQRQIATRNAENRLQEINEAIEANRAKETAEKRGALLDRVLASNPGNPNRAFDRALRLEGFRDATFTKEEKEKIARFNELRSIQEDGVFSAPNEAGAFGIREKRPSAVAGRYQHLADMLSSGWQLVNKHQLTGPNGEVYNLKGAGEAQFVRNKLNQKAGNGNQSPRDGSQGGTDQGDNGVGSAGANGPVPQGGGNGSGQANAIPDTDAPAGAVSEAEATGAGNQPNNSLARSRLTALEDQRIAKYADELRSMAPDSGWAEEGGRLLIAPDGTKSRTKWIPRAEWFIAGMLNSPQESVAAVEKAISGQPMRKAEKLHVQGMMDFLDMQYGIDGESHAEQLATLSDIAYEGESADAQNIIDTLGDVDLESIGAWNDEVESMRALGFTEEEINEITRRKQGAFGAIGEEAAGVPAGETQTAIPEGDGHGNGQAEGQGQSSEAVEIPYDTVSFAGEGQPLARSSGKSNIINFGGRMIVVRMVNGVRVPFYLSTGNGGKADVPSGKWYPFFGIGSDGWINKTGGADMTSYYGIKELRDVAEELDRTVGDIRDDETIPKVGPTGQHIAFINADFSPTENGQPNSLNRVLSNIDELHRRISGDVFDLSQQTEAELRAKAEAEAKAAADEAAAKKAAEDKAKADSEANDFRLSGSDRPADVAVAGGQQGLFGANGHPTKEAEQEAPKAVSIKDLALQEQAAAGWKDHWPFVPADLGNADFRELIASDPFLSDEEKDQIFSAGKKLGVIPANEGRIKPEEKPKAVTTLVRTYKTKSGKIGARIEKVVGPTGKTFYNYAGEWGAGSGHMLAQMDKIESMWRKEKRGYTVVEADAAPETTTAEDKLHTKDSEKKSPATLDEFIGAVDAGYRAHYDYAGADGSTVWIEKTEVSGQPAWVMKWIDDDHPGTTQTKGGAGLNVWDKLKALRAVEDKVKYRFTEWKPVAESAPSPVDTSMRDMGAKAFADGLPRVAPEGIKGADKVRWLTGYDTAKNGGRERHELPLDEQLAQAERDLETIMAGAEESGYVEDARVTDRINRQEKLIKEIKAEIVASQQKADTATKAEEQSAPVSQPENDKPAYADDAELQDALSHLGDVLGDVFGAKLNITGKQYGASDLLPAMSKVIELLIKKGFKSFRESVGAATNAMRGNANTKGFVDQITPRQWKAAYNSVAEFHEGTDSEEDVAKYSAEQIQKIIALPEKIKEADQLPPGTRTNGNKEKAAAERLAQLLDKMDQVRMDRNTPEGSAKGIIRSAIEELRKERTAVSVADLLDTASQRLFRQYSAFSDVVGEVAESLRAADKYAETVAKVKAKQEERNTPTLDKITVTRSATLDGKAVEYDQQADEALKEIDSNMDLAKRLLECLAA